MNASSECHVYINLYQDPSTTTTAKLFFAAIYSAIFLLGLSGNLAVIIVTLHQRSLQTVQNLFMLSLSVADLAVCLLSVPVTPITNIYKQWLFGRVLCHLIPCVQGTSIFIQSFSLTAIAVNRYVLILHPHLPPISRTAALWLIISIWTVSSALIVPYGYNMKIVRFEELCGEFCDEAWGSDDVRGAYSISVFAAQFLLPACLISYAYGTILCHLRKRTDMRINSIDKGLDTENAVRPSYEPMTSPSFGEEQRLHYRNQRAKLITRKRRTTIILICMVLIFIGAWLPYQALNIVIEIDDQVFRYKKEDFLYVIVTLTHAFAMTSVLANPVLYAWLNLAFRQTILKAISPTNARSPSSNNNEPELCVLETRGSGVPVNIRHSEDACTRPLPTTSHPPISTFSPCPCQKCSALLSLYRYLSTSSSAIYVDMLRKGPRERGGWAILEKLGITRRRAESEPIGTEMSSHSKSSTALIRSYPTTKRFSPPSIRIEHVL